MRKWQIFKMAIFTTASSTSHLGGSLRCTSTVDNDPVINLRGCLNATCECKKISVLRNTWDSGCCAVQNALPACNPTLPSSDTGHPLNPPSPAIVAAHVIAICLSGEDNLRPRFVTDKPHRNWYSYWYSFGVVIDAVDVAGEVDVMPHQKKVITVVKPEAESSAHPHPKDGMSVQIKTDWKQKTQT